MSRKKQIEITGKEETFVPTRLDQITSEFNEFALYGTKDEDEYISQLDGMNRSDLEAHALKLGIVPVEGVERLKRILVTKFQSYTNTLYKPDHKSPTPNLDDTVKRILAEGR